MSRRKKNIFLDMEIELVKDGKINTGMQSYIKEAIETFGEDVSIVVTSPAKSRLFDVTEGSEKFQKKKPQLSLNSGKAVVDNEEVTTRY